jgi:hypothetical protein
MAAARLAVWGFLRENDTWQAGQLTGAARK